MKKVHLIAAARPNFMKIAPLFHVLCKVGWAEPIIIHTGQHYDLNMSDVFFRNWGFPNPTSISVWVQGHMLSRQGKSGSSMRKFSWSIGLIGSVKNFSHFLCSAPIMVQAETAFIWNSSSWSLRRSMFRYRFRPQLDPAT